MLQSFEFYFLLFVCYAVLGWCMEVTVKKIQYGRFINRGFLIGPYCPIYGVGALLITLALERYRSDPLALFVMGMTVCAILEYLTSYVMERIFHARWWDYSTKRFNLNGRICLDTMIPFGLLGLVIMYALNPFFTRCIEAFHPLGRRLLSAAIGAGFLADCMVSATVLLHVRRENKALDKDNTEEMSAQVRAALAARGWTYRRLLDAFPNVRHIGEVIRENVEETREKLEASKERFEAELSESKERFEAEISESRKRFEAEAAESKERLEAELEKLEASHRKREAEFEARKQDLRRRLEKFRT